MPYINVSETNCLYVAVDEKEACFQKQCEIIKNWRSLNLSALDLIGLPTGFTEKELKKAKMKIYLHFHPDKNGNSSYSTEAFQILSHAVEFLAHQLGSSIDLSKNLFANEEPTRFKPNTAKTRSAPPPVSAEKQAYLAKLRGLAQSDQMTPEDEKFFRKALTAHPEYLPLVINQLNLFHVMLDKEGSSAFFQWLITQRYAEEALSKSKANQDIFSSAFANDVFSFAFDANRTDCLQILFDTYGIEGFYASSIEYSLSLCVLMSEYDATGLDTFWFLINELNYVPRNGHLAVKVLDQALETVDLSTFNKIYEKFKHLLLEPGQHFTHNSLISRVLTLDPGTAKIKLQKMADAGLIQHITDPLFQNARDLNSFLSQKNVLPIIQELQTKYNLMKDIGNISSEMIQQLSHASIMILLNLGLISVEDVLSNAQIYDLYHDQNQNGAVPAFELIATLKDKNQEAFTRWYSTLTTKIDDQMLASFDNAVVINLISDGILSVERILRLLEIRRISENDALSQTIFQQDRSAFHAWLKGIEFTSEYLKSAVGQAHLRLMLKYGITFTEQQLTTIQSTFDDYFAALAEKRVHYRAYDYRFLPQTTEAWLPILIECIGRSPNRMACLNKVYEHEVKVVVQADVNGNFYRANDSIFSTYEYTETILSSFTPLQFFMIMDKKPLAVLLLSLGVDWKQNLRATTQTGINNPSHCAYNPAKRTREIKINPQYVEERSVKVLSSNPDAETQKSIIDSKEIIFIHKNDQIEIGFCNTDYEYEQKVVSGVPNIIDAVERAKLTGKITNSADLDAIERYMVELGICLYSSKHIQSTVLDFVKTKIQYIEKFRSHIQSNPGGFSVGSWDEYYDDLGKDVKMALKQIQLNEAESYLYKRTLDADYKTKLSFFGFFMIMNFGFSKKEKITAVRALINFLKNDTPIPESCKPALYQGELGKIATLRDIVFAPDHPQVNSSGLSHNR